MADDAGCGQIRLPPAVSGGEGRQHHRGGLEIGFFPIPELPDECQESPEPPLVEPSIDEGLVVAVVCFVIGQVFVHRNNTFLHNAAVDLLTVALNYTECAPEIVRQSRLLERLWEVSRTTDGVVPFAGQLHQMVELIGLAEGFPAEQKDEWDLYLTEVYESMDQLCNTDYGGSVPDTTKAFPKGQLPVLLPD
jgi:hypothetical protein